jgi:succinate dehydrogenase / fumarate reductase flavoprotein subunit
LITAPGVQTWLKSLKKSAEDQPSSLYESERRKHQQEHDNLLKRSGGGENPYLLHQELGNIMTRAATVVRVNKDLEEAYGKVSELTERAKRCSLSDTGQWTNQNVVFTKALLDMFPIAKAIVKGALQRDECRGAHFKPAFALPGLKSTDPAGQHHEAEAWCDRFEENTKKWLKSTIATLSPDGEPELTYEDVDTSLIPPRPRLYGLVGAEMIDKVWTERQKARATPSHDGNGIAAKPAAMAVK